MNGVIKTGNLFANLPAASPVERVEVLAGSPGLRVENIVSTGQATPAGAWYDQDDDEWVVLLSGGAGLLFDGEAEPRQLNPGDWLLIPAHARHRVEWTSPDEPTVWLAVHMPAGAAR